jgi:RNA polymerase sigma-70 factor (ECF subfamily)
MPEPDLNINEKDGLIPFKTRLVDAQPDLVRFARKLSSDQDEINDLVQETLLKALDNEKKFEVGTNFLGWIYTIMKNIYVNKCRKQIQNQSYINNEGLIQGREIHDAVSDYSEYNYDIQEVYRLLNSLPGEYRVAFMMHMSGFKYKEIATKMNLPLGTVKSHIYLTRQKLLNIFKDLK